MSNMSTTAIFGTLLLGFVDLEESVACKVGFASVSFLLSVSFEVVVVVLAVEVASTGLEAVLNFLFCWPFDELLDKVEVEMLRFKLALMESFEEDECCSFEMESGELRSEPVGELRLDDSDEDEEDAIQEPLFRLLVFIVGKKFIESHKSSS